MLITMLETRRGTEDGYRIHLYMKGETYDIGDSLAHSFLSGGFAIPELPQDKLLPKKRAKAEVVANKPKAKKAPKVETKKRKALSAKNSIEGAEI